MQYIRADLINEFSDLIKLFPARHILPLKVKLFPSSHHLDYQKNANGQEIAYFVESESTIYIPLIYWNTAFRHELVHFFQYQVNRYDESPSGLTPSQARNKLESLAFFLAPQSWYLYRFRDLVNVLKLTQEQRDSIENFYSIGTPNEFSDLTTVNYILSTAKWHSTSSYPEAVALYYGKTLPNSNREKTLEDNRLDTLSENALAYYYSDNFIIPENPNTNFLPFRKFNEIADTLTSTVQISIAKWNRDNRSVLYDKLDWEVLLDTLGTGRKTSRVREIYDSAKALIYADLMTEAQLIATKHALRQFLNESIEKNYKALAAYLYLNVLEFEWLCGENDFTKPDEMFMSQYSLSYQDYIAYLQGKIKRQQAH